MKVIPELRDLELRCLELHDAVLTQVVLDTTTIRLECPALYLWCLRGGREETWWAMGRIVVRNWRSVRVSLPETWTGYGVWDGEVLEPCYGPLEAFRFSGIHLNLAVGTIDVAGGEGILEGLQLLRQERGVRDG